MTNLQKLAGKYEVEAFPFGDELDATTLENLLRALGVPAREVDEALALDSATD